MPRVTEAHRLARRREITTAALRCVARKGFRGTTVSNIIEESGLSAGAIYLHFASKAEIILAASDEFLGENIEAIKPLIDAAPAPHPVAIAGALVLPQLTREGPISSPTILQMWAEAAIDPDMRKIANGILERFRSVVRRTATRWAHEVRGDPPEVATGWAAAITPLVVGSTQGLVVQLAVDPETDIESYLEQAERAFS
jgi:AcrR family transcriptional regulator